MSHDEYIFVSSEIKELEALLAQIPARNAINRIGLEARLKSAKEAISGFNPAQSPKKAKLTFRGRPVFGSYGVSADFASKASGYFTDAFSAVVAGITENLRYMGPIPDKQKNQLLITGTAIGSFGFEFELPRIDSDDTSGQAPLFPLPNRPEDAMQKLEKLFQVAAEGSDDDIAELVEEIHPRAVKLVAEFLGYISEQEAWCGLEFPAVRRRSRIVRRGSRAVRRSSRSNLQASRVVNRVPGGSDAVPGRSDTIAAIERLWLGLPKLFSL
jgi:hypothetical protein